MSTSAPANAVPMHIFWGVALRRRVNVVCSEKEIVFLRIQVQALGGSALASLHRAHVVVRGAQDIHAQLG